MGVCRDPLEEGVLRGSRIYDGVAGDVSLPARPGTLTAEAQSTKRKAESPSMPFNLLSVHFNIEMQNFFTLSQPGIKGYRRIVALVGLYKDDLGTAGTGQLFQI